MNRFSPRAAFIMASALVHLMILLALSQVPFQPAQPFPPAVSEDEAPPSVVARIRMPPVYHAPAPARPGLEPTPPPPEDRRLRDRISVGGPAELRLKGPLVLRRDEDLTRSVARGRPDAVSGAKASPEPVPPPAASAAPPPEGPRAATASPAAGGLRLPEGVGPAQPTPARTTTDGLRETIRNLERRLASGAVGTKTGTGQQMGPLFFDPEGADFTGWINHFRTEVYRNWIVPPSVQLGARGHVDLEFVVHRDGRMTDLKLLRSAGTASLDRAAQNALLGSRLLPLPADFRPAQVAMQVSFFYNAVEHAS